MTKHEHMGQWAARGWMLVYGFYSRSLHRPPDMMASDRYDRRFENEKSFTHKQEYVKGFTGEINKSLIRSELAKRDIL